MRASPRPTRPPTHPEEATPGPGAQICGYLDLGLLAEAAGAARAALRQPTITAGDFRAAVSAILVSARRKRWWPLLRRAHRRLSRTDRVLVRPAMLRYHLATDNPQASRRHLPAAEALPALPGDELLTVMEACLLLGRPRRARQVADLCQARLEVRLDAPDAGPLFHALALYCAHVGEWDFALTAWAHVPPADPLYGDGLIGRVQVHALRALVATWEGLEKVSALEDAPADMNLELAAPGLTRALQGHTRRELRGLERTLRRIVPPSVQRAFGLEGAVDAPGRTMNGKQPRRPNTQREN